MSLDASCPECGGGFVFTGDDSRTQVRLPGHRRTVWEPRSGRWGDKPVQGDPCPASGLTVPAARHSPPAPS